MARLTDQRKLWADRYMLHWDATKAAIEAGYTKTNARGAGKTNQDCAAIGQYIAYKLEARNKRNKIDQDYVLNRVVEIDQLDLGDILDDDGLVLPVKQWPKAWRTSISGLDFGKLIKVQREGKPDKVLQLVEKIKWPDKLRNLELLGKHTAVKAWDKEALHSTADAPPLQITFEVLEAKASVQVTNAAT